VSAFPAGYQDVLYDVPSSGSLYYPISSLMQSPAFYRLPGQAAMGKTRIRAGCTARKWHEGLAIWSVGRRLALWSAATSPSGAPSPLSIAPVRRILYTSEPKRRGDPHSRTGGPPSKAACSPCFAKASQGSTPHSKGFAFSARLPQTGPKGMPRHPDPPVHSEDGLPFGVRHAS
jgi:hypothetical protein